MFKAGGPFNDFENRTKSLNTEDVLRFHRGGDRDVCCFYVVLGFGGPRVERQAIKARPDPTVGTGKAQPMWWGGLGWYSYLHHLTNSDQRWFLQVGAGAVAAGIRAATGRTGCAVAGIAAAVILPAVSEHDNPDPRICLEIELYYSGYLHDIYPTWC